MNIYIIAIVGVAFIVFFRENPVGAAIILGVAALVFYYYKSKKKNGRGNLLFGGRGNESTDENMRLLTFIALSKMFEESTDKNQSSLGNDQKKKKDFNEQAKQEVLKLFKR